MANIPRNAADVAQSSVDDGEAAREELEFELLEAERALRRRL